MKPTSYQPSDVPISVAKIVLALMVAASPIWSLAQTPCPAPANNSYPNCTASFETISPLLEARADKPMIIDIRSNDDYQELRALGAVNMAPFSVKARGYLHDRTVLLYDRPANRRVLEGVCRELYEAGFKQVYTIPNGLAGWVAMGQPLEGNTARLATLKLISVADLFSEMSYAPWLLIDASTTKEPGSILSDLPRIELPYSGTPADYSDLLRRHLMTARAKQPQIPVALFLDGILAEKDVATLMNLPIVRDNSGIVIVPEGRAGLIKYINNNDKILESVQRQNQSKSCG